MTIVNLAKLTCVEYWLARKFWDLEDWNERNEYIPLLLACIAVVGFAILFIVLVLHPIVEAEYYRQLYDPERR